MMAVNLAKRSADKDALAQARIDLAAALRLAVRFGLNEGIDNHFSLAAPGTADRFLLNPWGLHWDEVRASDLLIVDPAGKLISGAVEPEATVANSGGAGTGTCSSVSRISSQHCCFFAHSLGMPFPAVSRRT